MAANLIGSTRAFATAIKASALNALGSFKDSAKNVLAKIKPEPKALTPSPVIVHQQTVEPMVSVANTARLPEIQSDINQDLSTPLQPEDSNAHRVKLPEIEPNNSQDLSTQLQSEDSDAHRVKPPEIEPNNSQAKQPTPVQNPAPSPNQSKPKAKQDFATKQPLHPDEAIKIVVQRLNNCEAKISSLKNIKREIKAQVAQNNDLIKSLLGEIDNARIDDFNIDYPEQDGQLNAQPSKQTIDSLTPDHLLSNDLVIDDLLTDDVKAFYYSKNPDSQELKNQTKQHATHDKQSIDHLLTDDVKNFHHLKDQKNEIINELSAKNSGLNESIDALDSRIQDFRKKQDNLQKHSMSLIRLRAKSRSTLETPSTELELQVRDNQVKKAIEIKSISRQNSLRKL